MIFVTVGTTIPFDELFEEVDRLLESGIIDDDVICQTGQSKYIPRNCESFKFLPNLDLYLDRASLLIVHGGTGSTLQALASGKPFVAFANPLGADDHQAEFLNRLSQEFQLLWSRDVAELENLLPLIRNVSDCTEPREESKPSLPETIKKILF